MSRYIGQGPEPASRLGVNLATWFGTGYLPKAPGTWGSLAALPFAWIILYYGGYVFGIWGVYVLAAATVILFFAGLWAADQYLALHGGKDPAEIVIDEVVGQWLTIVILAYTTPFYSYLLLFAVAFVTFRAFDIMKPPPIGALEVNLGGGLGIMADDVMAAVYAAITGYFIGLIL
jgi:phosphatidylglycerophosphatase A